MNTLTAVHILLLLPHRLHVIERVSAADRLSFVLGAESDSLVAMSIDRGLFEGSLRASRRRVFDNHRLDHRSWWISRWLMAHKRFFLGVIFCGRTISLYLGRSDSSSRQAIGPRARLIGLLMVGYNLLLIRGWRTRRLKFHGSCISKAHSIYSIKIFCHRFYAIFWYPFAYVPKGVCVPAYSIHNNKFIQVLSKNA